ncbi:MAG: phosphomannomutase/phosphoglucomutase [Spirochaetia bacterium]|jgi:phosphomannomutase
MSVFKTYDVRGVWDQGIDLALAYRLGRALPRHMKAKTFLIGHDARVHSPELYRALATGLIDEGVSVTGIGLASTPLMHYTQMDRKHEAAVMVTASHNPPEYHGFKVFDSTGGSMSYDKGLSDVEALVSGITAPSTIPQRSFPQADGLERYVSFVAAAGGGKHLSRRIVIDISNGSSGPVFRRLAEVMGIDVRLLNADPDGTFPHHDPNPLKEESRVQAAREVVSQGAAFGVILDGDGDRILFVDEKGRGIENYFLSCLVCEELLARQKGAAIVYDLISSRVLSERIAELGGKPVVSRVGYTFLYDQMVASRAVFGAETSGHVYFKVSETYYTESAAYALAVILRLLASRARPLSELVQPLRDRYAQSPEINVEVADKQKAMEEIERRFPGGKVDRMDGVSISFDDFWFNVRPSNTEPLLRLRLEARNAGIARAKTEEIRRILAPGESPA